MFGLVSVGLAAEQLLQHLLVQLALDPLVPLVEGHLLLEDLLEQFLLVDLSGQVDVRRLQLHCLARELEELVHRVAHRQVVALLRLGLLRKLRAVRRLGLLRRLLPESLARLLRRKHACLGRLL